MTAPELTEPPGLDCLVRGHIWLEVSQPGAFPTADGETPHASWCLWCGAAVTNEDLGESRDG